MAQFLEGRWKKDPRREWHRKGIDMRGAGDRERTEGDRATIEQDFHDVKDVWGAGQQQVRNIWTNVAVFQLCLWLHTLVDYGPGIAATTSWLQAISG